jgi:hypothetical protein
MAGGNGDSSGSGAAAHADSGAAHHQQPGPGGRPPGPAAGTLTAAAQIDVEDWHAAEHRVAALAVLDGLESEETARAGGFVGLLSSATAFVAAMAWGRFLTAELDTDGVVDGKYNQDEPLPLDWSLVPTILYLFGVMWLVFFFMHRMHRYRDRIESTNEIWIERQQHWRQHHADEATTARGHTEDEANAERRARQLHAQFINKTVVNFTNGWTYTSMFMWTVLLHSFTVTLNLEGDLRTSETHLPRQFY